jgi:hypothetical protein
MTLDRITLWWASTANLQRLARALGVDLPPIPATGFRRDGWRRAAVRAIAAVTDPPVPADTRAGAP